MSTTKETKQVARRYFDAWTQHDSATVRACLAENFRFAGGNMAIEGREAFLNAGAFPANAIVTMVAEAYENETGFQMYDARNGDTAVRIVERLIVRDGHLAESAFVTDMAAFMNFMQG